MTIKKVLCYPDPRLRTKAKPITNFSDDLQIIIDDMLETMYEHNGVGLAATQVDVHLRLIVMDTSENRNEPLIIINPEILEQDGTEEFMEGCISFPGVYDKITRAAKIKFRAQDRHGAVYEMHAEELFAECVQHEMDHLEGKLMIDYLSPLKRERLVKKMKKLQQQTL